MANANDVAYPENTPRGDRKITYLFTNTHTLKQCTLYWVHYSLRERGVRAESRGRVSSISLVYFNFRISQYVKQELQHSKQNLTGKFEQAGIQTDVHVHTPTHVRTHTHMRTKYITLT